jgi:hypothetical protein
MHWPLHEGAAHGLRSASKKCATFRIDMSLSASRASSPVITAYTVQGKT